MGQRLYEPVTRPEDHVLRQPLKPWHTAAVIGGLLAVVATGQSLTRLALREAPPTPHELQRAGREELPPSGGPATRVAEDGLAQELRMQAARQPGFRPDAVQPTATTDVNPEAPRAGETPQQLEQRMNQRRLATAGRR